MQSKFSNILEIISAIAVVISLVFVGLEIRNSSLQTEQNTQALKIAAYQDLTGRIVEINLIGIEESVSIESMLQIKEPTEEETIKFNSLLWILFRHGDMAYFQFEQGAINEERMLSAMAPLLLRLEYQKVVERWNYTEKAFVPAYRQFIKLQIDKYSQSISFDFRNSERPNYFRIISAQDLAQKQEKVILIDVRLKEDFDKDPVLIPGAQYLDPEELPTWSKTLAKDKEIVVYCVGGKWVSQKAAFLLNQAGFNVSNLEGGLNAWKNRD